MRHGGNMPTSPACKRNARGMPRDSAPLTTVPPTTLSFEARNERRSDAKKEFFFFLGLNHSLRFALEERVLLEEYARVTGAAKVLR